MVCNLRETKEIFVLFNLFFSTCASGQWSCTELDCQQTCSILRNTHYTTFNGQYLKVDGGSCAHTAARYRSDANKFTLTLSKSVSKEYVNTLHGQLTVDGILFRILFLIFNKNILFLLYRRTYFIGIGQTYSC
jgi:hypothetical protein